MSLAPDLDGLWHETLGDPRVTVAVLDGPADLGHACLTGARLAQRPAAPGRPSRHGTFITSLIFGRHDGPVRGVAPACRGLVLPVFAPAAGDLLPCSQPDLARAIAQALDAGAQVINISAGALTPGGRAHPALAEAVRECTRRGAVVVAAVGNDACDCPHVPAALDPVLAVGAMDARGEPLAVSNWGAAYGRRGVLAPGLDLLGADAGGGTVRMTGTSGATALVSGVVALLLSLQLRRGHRPDPQAVRRALLDSARDCAAQPAWDCPRVLAGRLNVPGALTLLFNKEPPAMLPPDANAPSDSPAPAPFDAPVPAAVQPSACGCGTGPAQLVYALGQLEVDFVNEARLDSMAQRMARGTYAQKYKVYDEAVKRAPQTRDTLVAPKLEVNRKAPHDYAALCQHLAECPTDAAFLEWTLWLDGMPLYAVRPAGAFAAETYKELREFLLDHTKGVERVSVPGFISGTTKLFSGQVVPVVVPDIGGMYSWSTEALVTSAFGPKPAAGADEKTKADYAKRAQGIRHFLEKVYHGLRNLGVLPQDRALNYGATNCFNFLEIYEDAIAAQMELDSINVVRSPFCRPGSDCWDIELYFFKPEATIQTMRRVHRFTVDVSDVVPVTVGPIRSWSTR